MIVVGESNAGQPQTRARNKRRATESSVRSRETAVNKPGVVNGSTSGALSTTIVVDDEDDDVLVSSPRSFAQAKSNGVRLKQSVQVPRQSSRQSRVQVQDDPLELRLGLGDPSAFRFRSTSQCSESPAVEVRWSRPGRPSFDQDCVVLSDKPQSRKRKEHPLMPFEQSKDLEKEREKEKEKEKEKELKLVCAICMDTMKQETSTVCGHIFCQSCIQGAIQAQKKCPTCRRKLHMKNIHRIYISTS